MRSTALGLISLLAFASLSATAAFSADAATTNETAPAPMQSMQDFMQANPDCQQFTDQCSICAVVDGKAQCSTPQIACVKQAYQCTVPPGK
ncbi:hypothetical protein [Rhizobium mayense]|uniref:Uncharacterized protein n=1 Tax=Rhizobium mayense TaxID=1312184 RepID=A0ABT7JX31_9HYPH|nr:hypothetical protein [Rhizobium mayense]MDL2400904.1 hypothetical protein [Rhizobium mayense]